MMKRILPASIFFILSLVYFWPVLIGDSVLLPTSPLRYAPWSDSPSSPGKAIPSNNLMSDSIFLTYPWRVFNATMLRQGELPLWNPYIFCGFPHFALIQSNAFYPLTLPFDLIDPVRGIGYSMALQLALSGLLMFRWLQRIGLDWKAAILGGVVFQFNGMFLIRMGAPSYVFSGIWLPLLLLGIDHLISESSLKKTWMIVLAVFLSFLGGHPQIFALVLLIGGSYFLFRAWSSSQNRFRLVALFTGSVILGLLLAAFQLIPFLELVRNTSRGAYPLSAYKSSALPVVALLQGIFPDIFGHPVDRTYWFHRLDYLIPVHGGVSPWEVNYSGENIYTGIVPLVLGGVAVFKRRCNLTLFFFCLILFAFCILLGTPILDFAYYVIPTFRHSRPDRILYLFMAGISVLSALGYDYLLRPKMESRDRKRPAIVLLMLLAFLVLVVGPILFSEKLRAGYVKWFSLAWLEISKIAPGLRIEYIGFIVVLVFSSILIFVRPKSREGQMRLFPVWLLLAFLPMMHFGWRFNPMQKSPLFTPVKLESLLASQKSLFRVVRFMSHHNLGFFPSNIPQTRGIFDVNGASAVALKNYQDLIEVMDREAISKYKYFWEFTTRFEAPLRVMDYLNVQFIFSNRNLPMPVVLKEDGSRFFVYENNDFFPRFFSVVNAEIVPDQKAAVKRFVKRNFDRSSIVLLSNKDEHILSKLTAGQNLKPAQIDVISYHPSRIELEASADSPSILVSSEVFYPGWKTFIDGNKIETLVVNGIFRGAYVPAGKHRISLVYSPGSLKLGALISIVVLIALIPVYIRKVDPVRT